MKKKKKENPEKEGAKHFSLLQEGKRKKVQRAEETTLRLSPRWS